MPKVGWSLKSAVAIAQLDSEIAIAGKNEVQLLVIVHIAKADRRLAAADKEVLSR